MAIPVGVSGQIKHLTFTLAEWADNKRKAQCHRCATEAETETVGLVIIARNSREVGAYFWCPPCVVNFFKRFKEMEREARDADEVFT